MLVLTRRPGQALMIGDSIEIYVAEIRGDVVRLSISAPRSVRIMRREVLEGIRMENLDAAQSDADALESFLQPSVSSKSDETKKESKS